MAGKTQLLLKIIEILHLKKYLARDCDSFQDVDTAAHHFLLLSVDHSGNVRFASVYLRRLRGI